MIAQQQQRDHVDPVYTTNDAFKSNIRHHAQLNDLLFEAQKKLVVKCVNMEVMRSCSGVIRPMDYEVVVSERVVNEWCGYPMCGEDLKKKKSRSYRDDNGSSSRAEYCSLKCFNASQAYKNALSDEALASRPILVANLEASNGSKRDTKDELSPEMLDHLHRVAELQMQQMKAEPAVDSVEATTTSAAERAATSENPLLTPEPLLDTSWRETSLSRLGVVLRWLNVWRSDETSSWRLRRKYVLPHRGEMAQQRARAFRAALEPLVPRIFASLSLPVTLYDFVSKRMNVLITTMLFNESVASLDSGQWTMIVMVLLKCVADESQNSVLLQQLRHHASDVTMQCGWSEGDLDMAYDMFMDDE